VNVTNQDQGLSEGTTIEHEEPAVWAAAVNDQKPQTRRKQGLRQQLKEMIAVVRRNVSLREAQGLEELIADNQDMFASKSCGYACT
jgi:hypothetical protein